MKILKVFVFIIFSYIVISNVYGKAQEAEFDWEKNAYGKVTGWIIDPETNEPVNEKFNLRFFYIDPKIDPKKPFYFNAITDQNGFFSRKLLPGKYYVHSAPIRSSKYCFEPYPYKNLENAYIMDIKNGQITKIYKKASIGGNLKVILVDPEGRKINVQDVFQNHKFDVSISNKKAGENICIISTENRSDDKREFFFRNIAPGKYTIRFNTSADIGCQRIDNIIIEKQTTTEFELVIDTNTGIEGIITDVNGEPVESAGVTFRSNTDPTFFYEVFTDVNGYFSLLGLKEGSYDIGYYIEDENGDFYGGSLKNIIIKENTTTVKNIVLKMVKVE